MSWPIQADGKYWRAYLAGVEPRGLKMDVFLCTPQNWGAILLIRTGSAQFSQALVTHARNVGRSCHEGHFTKNCRAVDTPEERDVFDMLGLEYVEPAARWTRWNVIAAGSGQVIR